MLASARLAHDADPCAIWYRFNLYTPLATHRNQDYGSAAPNIPNSPGSMCSGEVMRFRIAGLTLVLLFGWRGAFGGLARDPVDEAIDRMSVDERIGHLLFIAFTGTATDSDLEGALAELHPGGVLFYGRNIGTLGEVRALTRRLHRGPLPPLAGIDEEGGFVTRLPEGIPR